MNARFLEKLVAYRNIYELETSRSIITQKISYQLSVCGVKKAGAKYLNEISRAQSLQDIFLVEARAAKFYWKIYGELCKNKIDWRGRRPHRNDVANKLLDIGYHFLTQKITIMCQELNLPTELGFLHKAQSHNAHPLVYDLIEWLRPITVDRVLLKIVRKKKLKVKYVDQKIITYLIYKIKKEFEKNYYNKHLKYCISLEYWTTLVLYSFIGAVNANKIFRPHFPSLRHETRCNKKPLKINLKR